MNRVIAKEFNNKWNAIRKKSSSDETSIFVEKGRKPATQRQFNLFHYFEYIKGIAKKNGFKNILEVGCGRGTMSLYLAEYLGLNVTLVDASEEAINLARHNFEQFRAKGNFKVNDAENLSFNDNTFDMVVSIGLAEHFEDYSRVYSEQFRVLKPGGIMVSLNIPQKHSIQALNIIYRFFLRLSKKPLKKDYFRNADKPKDYRKTAQQAGFKQVEVFYVNPFPLFTPVGKRAEHIITAAYRIIYKLRGLFIKYPFKGSRLLSQAHFLIGRK
jgi:ubiquinone/menaquinone biosynthesis C-methylase UbiE